MKCENPNKFEYYTLFMTDHTYVQVTFPKPCDRYSDNKKSQFIWEVFPQYL